MRFYKKLNTSDEKENVYGPKKKNTIFKIIYQVK